MTTFYNHNEIEKKWQARWLKSDLYQAADGQGKKKYILDMFPYPSGDGLHVGHPESYTATDIMARYFRFKGFNVLHPMGWDAFGLPAENYAIKSGVHPKITTTKAIANFRRQIQSLGFSYDWTREVNTSSPDYYKWTQWLFLQLYKKGLAIKKKAPVNWCSSCQTVLANEQVVDGKCERCLSQVIQKDLEQWFFKVTAYAEELLNKLDELDWSDALKAAQRNWIGKSAGALLEFQISNFEFRIQVFTTRPDTLFGATYIVLAPEYPIIENLKLKIENWQEVENYIQKAKNKKQLERTDLNKEKTGVELKGVKAINPATKQEIPIWIADYVLTGYGTGAIMAVPAHDERDWEFAKKYHLEITPVILGGGFWDSEKPISDYKNLASFIKDYEEKIKNQKPYVGEGILINSGKFNRLRSKQAKKEIIKFVKGKSEIQYKIRDWLISRQRYWGAPIPIIYCSKCARLCQGFGGHGEWPVPEKDLPVLLPNDVDFRPTGESPLVRSKKFHKVKCPKCDQKARRESDTMDTFVCSSWYFLRYCDPKNNKDPFDKKKVKYWLPIDLYIGGMEHAVGHLIYARFIYKALIDLGCLPARHSSERSEERRREPFLKMRNQGVILASDGRKMSKRWHNIINPDDVVSEFGADTMRMYEMFMGPLEDMKPWSKQGIIGIRRFLEKVYKLISNSKFLISNEFKISNLKLNKNFKFKIENSEIKRLLHKTIKKVTGDIESLRFNTAISAMMIFMNRVGADFNPRVSGQGLSLEIVEKFLIILSPFAPHLAEELWEKLGHKESIFLPCRQAGKQSWPAYDKKLVIDDEVTIAIQVNGKLRETIKVERGISEHDLRIKIEDLPNVQKYLAGQEVRKFIYIKDKLVNLIL